VALGTLCTLGAEFALDLFCYSIHYDPIDAFEMWPGLVWPPVIVLVLFWTIGGIVLWLGMIRDCATARGISAGSRLLWLLLIVLTPDLGALIYYFCVFCRQQARLISERANTI
jgi:hypothetical protein